MNAKEDINGTDSSVRELMNVRGIECGMQLLKNVYVPQVITGVGMLVCRSRLVRVEGHGFRALNHVYVILGVTGMGRTVWYAPVGKYGVRLL